MDTNSARNRANVATATKWVKDPMTYKNWVWDAASVTNTQWGIDDADLTDTKPAATLTNKTPKCTVDDTVATATVLTIPIAQDLTTTDYSTFKIKFTAKVTLPDDILSKTTSVKAMFKDAAGF
jgi:hypothetical protein